jgi:hypothetical protein
MTCVCEEPLRCDACCSITDPHPSSHAATRVCSHTRKQAAPVCVCVWQHYTFVYRSVVLHTQPYTLGTCSSCQRQHRHSRKHAMNECERTAHTPQRGSAGCTHPSQPLVPPEVAFLLPTGMSSSTVESNGRIYTCCDAHTPCAQRTMHTQWPTQARLNVRTSSVMAAAAAPAASGSAMSVARSWLCCAKRQSKRVDTPVKLYDDSQVAKSQEELTRGLGPS